MMKIQRKLSKPKPNPNLTSLTYLISNSYNLTNLSKPNTKVGGSLTVHLYTYDLFYMTPCLRSYLAVDRTATVFWKGKNRSQELRIVVKGDQRKIRFIFFQIRILARSPFFLSGTNHHVFFICIPNLVNK